MQSGVQARKEVFFILHFFPSLDARRHDFRLHVYMILPRRRLYCHAARSTEARAYASIGGLLLGAAVKR